MRKILGFRLLHSQSGQSLLELLVLIGVAAIFLPALLTGLVAAREGKAQQQQRLYATSILKETNEAVRIVRENGWDTFAINGTYHPIISGSTWTLATGSGTVNGFTKSVVISDVYRDANGVIVASGGSLDGSTKKIVSTISWGSPIPSSVTSTMYLTRFLENEAYTETTQTQFNAGTKSGVTVRATSGSGIPDDGEIVLGSGGYSDWCEPTLLANSFDMPGQGYPSSITTIEGKIFMGTGENASGVSYLQANVTDTHPPVASFVEDFDGHKTNGVFGETNYGYISTDTNSKEVVIINTATTPFSEAGYFNAPGNGTGKGIAVSGSVGYMTAGNKFFTFDLTSKNGSRGQKNINDVTLSGVASKIQVVGSYAYVALSSGPYEMQILDVTNPENISVVGQANVDSQPAQSLYVNSSGTRVYLATAASATQRELFIIDTTTKTGNRPAIGTGYDAQGMSPKGVTVVPGNRAILVGSGGNEYQVIDISNESSPQGCASLSVDEGIHDVASVVEADTDAYSYIVTGNADKELRIIEGGPGGGVVSTGIFESATFDPGYSTANNRFTAVFDEPANTNIQFQVSMVNKVGGVCPTSSSSYTFVGPSGTSADWFSPTSGQPITFPFTTFGTYTNPGECLRYKASLTSSDGTSTPVLYSVTINYSP